MSGKDALQIVAAVTACRLSRMVLRGLNRGGTALPGKLAMWFKKDILAITSEGIETILVTGTNGKTTTAAMLAHAMEAAGRAPLCNRSGANLLSGVTAEFAAAADLRGHPMQGRKMKGNRICKRKSANQLSRNGTSLYAVIECDEGALHQVAPLLHPRVIVVTNVFRDQLDRYGEVMHTLEAIREGIRLAPEAVLCLNADDSLVASLDLELPNPVVWFGMEETAVHVQEETAVQAQKETAVQVQEETAVQVDEETASSADIISDARYCIRCGAEYTYGYHTYAHLGDFRCPSCGYSRPVPHVAVTSIDGIDAGGSRVHMRIGRKDTVSQRIALPAVYNIYNAAAALAAYQAAGLPAGEILQGLANMKSSFGRMEQFVIGGVSVQMILVKNPAGCNQALDYLCALRDPCTLVLCLNDLDADGHDISWIWDVDYEKLSACPNIRRILVWGRRAEDMQLRLKYAGIKERCITRFPDKNPDRLLDRIYHSREPVFILPNYTTMLPLRDALRKAAGKGSFWKG